MMTGDKADNNFYLPLLLQVINAILEFHKFLQEKNISTCPHLLTVLVSPLIVKELIHMLITVKSPFVPLFFKQKLIEENIEIGFLRTSRLAHQLKNMQSYTATYKGKSVKLIEKRKVNRKRNWDLIEVEESGLEINKGQLILTSSTDETLSKGYTEYILEYNERIYSVKKPYMHKKNFCELLSGEGKKIATHLEQDFFSFKRYIKIDVDQPTKSDKAVFLLALSLITFIS